MSAASEAPVVSGDVVECAAAIIRHATTKIYRDPDVALRELQRVHRLLVAARWGDRCAHCSDGKATETMHGLPVCAECFPAELVGAHRALFEAEGLPY